MTPDPVTEPGTPLEWALRYATGGWRVLPIKPGEKRPPMASWQHAATTNPTTIGNWYNGLYRGHGVGIATGRESGIWVLDIDRHDTDGQHTLDDLEQEHGTLPPTVEAVTGSDGRHLVFRYPPIGDGWKIGTTKNIGAGIDVRGDGGQIVAAPTIHPNGTPYRWRTGHAPNELPVAHAPAWLLELVTVAPPTPAPSSPAPIRLNTPSSDGAPDSIAEWVNTTLSWHDVLHADGWSIDTVRGEDTHWTRPGKTGGTSAVLHGDGPLVVFTTNVPTLQRSEARGDGDTWAYSLFGYLAATRHNGDRSACAKSYRNAISTPGAGRGITLATSATAVAALDDDSAGLADDEWQPTDLADIAAQLKAGTFQPVIPTVLEVDGALPLFYRERINSLFGESGGGKTWVGLAALAEAARNGDQALMIDYEDAPAGIAERLVALGLTVDQIRHIDYINPTTGIGYGAERLIERSDQYAVIVVDSTGEAMAAGGVDANADREVAQWFAIVKKLCRLPGGPAVIVLDHVPKDKDAPSAYAIGSQRKRAAVTGAAYRVDTIKEPAKGRDGKLKLTVAKDRPGNRAKGTTAALIDMLSRHGAVDLNVHVDEAQAAVEAGDTFRPTVLMERVSRYLEQLSTGVSQRTVCQEVTGKASGLRSALEVLVDEGYVKVGSTGYELLQPFREVVDNPNRVPASQARPTASRDAAEGARPRVPDIHKSGTRDAPTEAETTTERVPVDNPHIDTELELF